jgi:ATP-dependent Clp protease protease subunit
MTANQNLVPIVIEKSGRTERAYDIYSRLLKDRIVFLGGPLDDELANLIIAQMLFLSNEDNKNDVHFYINSPGGSMAQSRQDLQSMILCSFCAAMSQRIVSDRRQVWEPCC